MLQIKNAALAYENNLVFSHLDLHLKVGEFACISGASGVECYCNPVYS